MQKTHKDLLRSLVMELRHTLDSAWDDAGALIRGDLDRELERIGIGTDGSITPLDALHNPSADVVRAHRTAEVQLSAAPKAERSDIRAGIVERAAYTWINRLLALRALEARGLIEETLRINPAYEGISEALYLLRFEEPQRTGGADGGWWAVLEKACRTQAQLLPGLFDWDDPNVALRPSTTALLRCVQAVGRLELDPVFADPDAISWSYQFYQEEAKKRVYAKLGRGGKVESRSEIAAATQLFTEPYMVQWLLQNSLGRSYHEAYPDSALPAGWDYYIDREKILADDVGAVSNRTDGIDEDVRLKTAPTNTFSLSELTFLDPCTGSGHFQREAFDMLFAMYGEQHPEMGAKAIADRILSHHLHGIDIDPRAVQLAGVTLVLRAWERVGSQSYTPPALNLATTPARLDAGALERHLQAYPEDRLYRPILAGVFAALEQAPILGSLLKPEEHLESAIQEFRKQRAGGQAGLLAEDAGANRLLAELARHDPEELKKLLLERIARSFAQEARQSDVAAQLLGREAGEGVHLLQLLARRYAVVATNPPYMGSGNMDSILKDYVFRGFNTGKYDLCTAFIIRCIQLAVARGRIAMITQQNWMFLKSYAQFRASSSFADKTDSFKERFAGLLRSTTVETLAHLGPNAFEEISGEVVKSVLFVVSALEPDIFHRILASQVLSSDNPWKKAEALRTNLPTGIELYTQINQKALLALDQTPIVYQITDRLLTILTSAPTRLGDYASIRPGLQTSDNSRFTRTVVELPNKTFCSRWWLMSKGGGYCKWAGNKKFIIDWEYEGARIKEYNERTGDHWSRNVRNVQYVMLDGLTYSSVNNAFGVRKLWDVEICDTVGTGIYPIPDADGVMTLLNSRLINFFLKTLSADIHINPHSVSALPMPVKIPIWTQSIGLTLTILKNELTSYDLEEYTFSPLRIRGLLQTEASIYILHSMLGVLEGFCEEGTFHAYELSSSDRNLVIASTGTPAGWHPLLTGYDALPALPPDLDLPPLPSEVLDYLTQHERIHPAAEELARIKANLQALYEAGPGAKDVELDDGPQAADDDEEEGGSGAYIPIPTEIFLEELSVKLQIHPISVYWLLEDLRAEGVRCKPEEQRLLEDRLSVLVLRLLGHRWPKQIEAGEPVPTWADKDGVIPLTVGTGESTLVDRIRARLRAEEGDLGAQQTESLLHELTGRDLAEWLRRDFFQRHTSQFKRRPIAWHLASDPRSAGRKKSAQPAFECLLYYHATSSDILARLRTQYVDRLLAPAQRDLAQARRDGNETVAAQAVAIIQELEDFTRRLRQVEEGGFACGELDTFLDAEPLDRWAGDGVFPPSNQAELLAQEEGWQVDINDGVRVNVAPLQQAGLLVSDVLAKKEIAKAIADRARWRSDERRWVRAGKLPRCGWMGDDVPESPRWTELAPEREKERARLEEKRAKVLAELGGGVEA